ncbi:MAG: EAL domain-containing protein [Lachnospiraceae bacterium]|nr:EAL domain-containing protein [Lachnospiraceae bacterium]
MKQQNGIIYTNNKCIGCNRCIMSCPVPGANKSVVEDGKNKIIVDHDKCIGCGNCIRECRHEAREYRDDTEWFVEALGNENLSVILDPAIFLLYPDFAGKFINFLLASGVSKIYDAGFGTDISVWAYLKYLDEHPEGGVILQTCPSFIDFVEKYSREILSKLIPVQSPAVCTAIYVHKYLKSTDKLAYIGPCIAKKKEFESPETFEEISYNVTFMHLARAFANVDFSSYSNDFPERNLTFGSTISFRRGLKHNLTNFIPEDKFVLAVDNAIYHLPYYEYYEHSVFNDINIPYATDVTTCEHGCVDSPGVGHGGRNLVSVVHDCVQLELAAKSTYPDLYSGSKTASERKAALYERFKELDPADFKRDFKGRFLRKPIVTNSAIEDIYTQLYKFTEQDRCIDCGSCGYGTCKELAEAVALGYNRKENCVYYEKEENRRLYLTDIMTGIPNISYFNSKLAETINSDDGGNFAVVAFSLQGWELLNERFTYTEGDKCIIEFAKIVEKLAGLEELVAHHGGVDFLAVIKKKNLTGFLNTIQSIVVHPNDGLQDVEYHVSIIAGIYMMNNYERAAETVVGRTNIAAANAKLGPNKIVYYDQSMKEQLIDSIQLTKSFPDAMENEEFLVYYQPKINTETQIMKGAEALVRWKTKKELISPARFIPLFEKNGMICQLDFYVLNRVCSDLRKWLDDGLSPVCISVNFSKLHFKNPDFVLEIERQVDKYNIPHNLIEIEITESAYEKTKERLKAVLKDLNMKGFSTSIDDFGAGYSSLNLLSQLDFQVLKLDKAFLDSGIEDIKVKNVVDSVITMAKKLNMKVVAEGVERKEELELLKNLSCDLIQGYYFDRPIPKADFEKRLEIPDYYQYSA